MDITPFTDNSIKSSPSLQLMTIAQDDKNSFPPKYTPPVNLTKDAYTLDISQNAFLLYGISDFLENKNISLTKADMNQMISSASSAISSFPSTLNINDFNQFKTSINNSIKTHIIENKINLENFNIPKNISATKPGLYPVKNIKIPATSDFVTYNSLGISSSKF